MSVLRIVKALRNPLCGVNIVHNVKSDVLKSACDIALQRGIITDHNIMSCGTVQASVSLTNWCSKHWTVLPVSHMSDSLYPTERVAIVLDHWEFMKGHPQAEPFICALAEDSTYLKRFIVIVNTNCREQAMQMTAWNGGAKIRRIL